MGEFDAPDIYGVSDRLKRYKIIKTGRKLPDGKRLCLIVDAQTKDYKKVFEGNEFQCYAWVMELTMRDAGEGNFTVVNRKDGATVFKGPYNHCLDYIGSAFKFGVIR